MEQYLTCNKCGKEFTHWNAQKSYCDECSTQMKRERNRKFMQKKRGKIPITQRNKSLDEIMNDLSAYNKEHGTCLSYGQFVSMIKK